MSIEVSRSPPHVKASTVQQRLTFVDQCFGKEAHERYLGAVSPQLVRVFEGSPKSWVEFGHFVEATVLIDQIFGKGDLTMCWEVGRFASQFAVSAWKQFVMRRIRPTTIVSLASSAWSQYYDAGRIVSSPAGPSALRLEIAGFPQPHRAHCLSIGGWVDGSIAAAPGRQVHVQELSCRAIGDAQCVFLARWRD